MKKTFLIILLFTNSFAFFAQEIYEKPVVDERVELMSTVFRLVGTPEYVSVWLPMYTYEVDKYFEKYKDHPLIEYSTKLLKEYGVWYNAVAQFSIFLEIQNGKIDFRKDIKIESLDERWHRDSIPKYLDLLNDFYTTTKFNDFFVQNEHIRKVAEENYAKDVTDKVDFDWFKRFFGILPEKKLQIIISLLNGGSNYGTKLIYNDDTEEYYVIMGSWMSDKDGFPIYEDRSGDFINMLIHEISHPFSNPFLNKYKEEMMKNSNIYYGWFEEKVRSMGYGNPDVFIYEAFVRACAIHYGIATNVPKHRTNLSIAQEIDNGFLWLPQLLEAFKKYEGDTIYKTFYDFMPEIIKFYNSIDPQKLYDEIENNKPTITGISIENGSDSIDYNLDRITVYFDKPMSTANFAYNCCDEGYAELDWASMNNKWNAEGTEWTLYFKLEPDEKYYIGVLKSGFVGLNNLFPRDSYIITFKTRKNQ